MGSHTHDLMRPEAVRTLEGADFLIHAGDIDKSQVLEVFRSATSVRGHTTYRTSS
ncbi:MAG: hypothetical protein QF619_06800 [Candidatus Binatia bacterium]|nr:hypothetical protein [Candidatus Binatia bacterium]